MFFENHIISLFSLFTVEYEDNPHGVKPKAPSTPTENPEYAGIVAV